MPLLWGHNSSPLFSPCLLSKVWSMSVFGPTIPALTGRLMKTNLFGLKPTTLCGLSVTMFYPYNGILRQCGFQSLTALYHYKILLSISRLVETYTPEQFVGPTRTLNLQYYNTRLFCSISYAYDSLFSSSQHFLPFSELCMYM